MSQLTVNRRRSVVATPEPGGERTIALIPGPPESAPSQWRHTDHAGRRHRRDRFATIPIVRYRPAVADAVSAASRKQGRGIRGVA
jgi:hypothetical protein